MRIKIVVAKNVNDLLHRSTVVDYVAEGRFEREIEDGCEAGVEAIELLSSAFKKRGDGGIGVGHFANVIELGIDLVDAFVPSAPELARGIGKRIEAKSVELRHLRPPHRSEEHTSELQSLRH